MFFEILYKSSDNSIKYKVSTDLANSSISGLRPDFLVLTAIYLNAVKSGLGDSFTTDLGKIHRVRKLG